MAKKKDSKEKSEEHVHKNQMYVLIGIFAVAFVLGLLLSNFINNQTIEKLSTENKGVLESIQTEKQDLRTQRDDLVSEKTSLKEDNDNLIQEKIDLVKEVQFTENLLHELENTGRTVRRDIINLYELSWDNYIIARPGKDFVSKVDIENLGIQEGTFTLEVRMKNKYNNAFTDSPTSGSLTLRRDGSGTINLMFRPKKEGYGVYGLFVNNNHAGDMVIFVRK